MRADARRNRERVLVAARALFAEHGAGASLDDVARRAGVGPGTLYRHFPNREALQEAVYRESIEDVCARGRELGSTLSPGAALDRWLELLVEHMASRRGLAEALVASAGKDSEVFVACHRALHDTGGELVERAQAAGAVRADLEHRDLLWLVHGVAQAAEGDGGDARAARMLAITLAGLRVSAAPSGTG